MIEINHSIAITADDQDESTELSIRASRIPGKLLISVDFYSDDNNSCSDDIRFTVDKDELLAAIEEITMHLP